VGGGPAEVHGGEGRHATASTAAGGQRFEHPPACWFVEPEQWSELPARAKPVAPVSVESLPVGSAAPQSRDGQVSAGQVGVVVSGSRTSGGDL
jgi:hypothetical protein